MKDHEFKFMHMSILMHNIPLSIISGPYACRSTITKPFETIRLHRIFGRNNGDIGTDGDDRRLMRQMDSDGEYFVGH